MDLCYYCREYHPTHQICDGLIEDLSNRIELLVYYNMNADRLFLNPFMIDTANWILVGRL